MLCVDAHQDLRKALEVGLWLTHRPDCLSEESLNEWGSWGNNLFHYSVSYHSALSKHSSNWRQCILRTVCTHVSRHMSVCARRLMGNSPESPSFVFAAKPIRPLAKYCFLSVIVIRQDGAACKGNELALLRPQWQWYMLTLHKYIITCYTCSPLPHLA